MGEPRPKSEWEGYMAELGCGGRSCNSTPAAAEEKRVVESGGLLLLEMWGQLELHAEQMQGMKGEQVAHTGV